MSKTHADRIDDRIEIQQAIDTLAQKGFVVLQKEIFKLFYQDAERYRFIREGNKDVWCSSGDDLLHSEQLDQSIDRLIK